MSHPIDQSRKADQLDFLKAVVETTDAIVVASSPEAGIIWVNQAFERITGYAEEEAIGRPIWSFRVPEEVESGRRSFQAAARNDGRRFESRWLTKSGKELILSWSTRPVTDDQGNVRFRVGTAIDITAERQNAARALDLGEMLDQVGEAVILVNRDSVIQYANREAVLLYRMPLEEMVGRSNREFVPEEETERFREFTDKLRRTMEPQAIETTRIRGDGTRIPIHLRVSPIRNRAGALTGFVSVSYDISAQLELEAKARAAAERNAVLAKLLDNLPDPVFHLLPDGNLAYTNAAVRDVYGFDPEELVGGPMSRVRPLDRTETMGAFINAIREDSQAGVIETQALHKNGHRVEVELHAVRIEDDNGNDIGIAGFARDIRERKRLESELKRRADTDELTGLANRRRFDQYAASEVKRAVRYRHPLSVVACDLDHFKAVNDRFGHAGGDAVLRRFADILLGALRVPTDMAARIGGEEFVLVLPETGAAGARDVAERIRRRIQAAVIDHDGKLINVTVSLGISEFAFDETSLAPALKRADMALYEAKEAGRNRVAAS